MLHLKMESSSIYSINGFDGDVCQTVGTSEAREATVQKDSEQVQLALLHARALQSCLSVIQQAHDMCMYTKMATIAR